MTKPFRIAHVSDIHAAGRWFDPEAFERGVAMVNAMAVDQVVFTGDLTDHGTSYEFEEAAALLDRFTAPIVSVMGNHDAMRDGWRLFADRLMGGERYFARDWDRVRFVGLDSAEPDIHEGHIGREQMAWLERLLDQWHDEPGPSKPIIVALHHHVIPVPGTGRERNILLDAGDFLRALDRHAVAVVLTGHKHQPWAWRINDTVIATTGTFASRKTNCGQNMNLVEVDDTRVTITNHDVATGHANILGTWTLPNPATGDHGARSTGTSVREPGPTKNRSPLEVSP